MRQKASKDLTKSKHGTKRRQKLDQKLTQNWLTGNKATKNVAKKWHKHNKMQQKADQNMAKTATKTQQEHVQKNQ